MQKDHNYFVYIMASISGTLYVGVTSDLEKRVQQHKLGAFDGFSKKYGCNRLVYYEQTSDVKSAIEREKQIKKWNRNKKESLIQILNPAWIDLAKDILA